MADQEPSTTRTPPPEESDKPTPKTEKEEEEANNNNGNNSTTDDADRVKELEEENSVLRSMLSRANHRDPVYSTPQEKLQLQVEKLQAELKKERETRLRGQSLLAETRSQFEIIMLRKDQELKKTSDLYTKTANECESFRQRYRDAEALITVLKRDLTQCRDQLLKRTGSTAGSTDMSAPPDYRHQHGSGSAAPPVNRGGSATPSRHFSQLLRSISPAALQRNGHHSTHQEVIGSPAPKGALTPRAKSPSHQGTTTTSPTATTRGPRKPSTLEFKVGQRVLWNSHHGVIRFIGTVHCLDEGQYFGVELQHAGDGEHNGTLGGVKYFSAAPKGGVFCKMTEIVHAPKPVAKPTEEATSNKDNEPKKDEDNEAKATATEEKKDPAPARKPARKPASRAVSPAANGRKTEEKPSKKAAAPSPASKTASKKPATKPAAKSSTPSKKKKPQEEEEKPKKEEEPQQQQQQSEEEQQKPQEQQTEPAPAEQTNEEKEATATSEQQSTTADKPAPTAAEKPKEEEKPQDEPSTDEPQAEQQTKPADETTADSLNDEQAPPEPSTETEPAATTTAPAEADASAEKATQPQEPQEKEEQTSETAATNHGEDSQAEDQSPSEEVVATNAEQKEDDQKPTAPEEEEKKADEEGEKPQQEGTAGQDDQA